MFYRCKFILALFKLSVQNFLQVVDQEIEMYSTEFNSWKTENYMVKTVSFSGVE